MLLFLNDLTMPEGTHLDRVHGAEQAGSNCENSICFYSLRYALWTMRYAILYIRR